MQSLDHAHVIGGHVLSSGGREPSLFIAKLTGTGAHVFSTLYGGAGAQYGFGLAVDASGSPILASPFDGFLEFGSGPLVSGDASNIFLAALDASGQHRWSKRFGSAGPPAHLQCDPGQRRQHLDHRMLAGDTDFGNGMLSSAGGNDAFIASQSQLGMSAFSVKFTQ